MDKNNILTVMKKYFPLLGDFKSRELAIKVAEVWYKLWKDSKWKNLEDASWRLPCPGISLVNHTNNVAREAIELAKIRNEIDNEKINFDILLAGALLHDACRLLELETRENSVIESKRGKLFQHGFIGACRALIEDLPDEVVHIIICHTGKSRVIPKTREAIVVHYVDSADADLYAYKFGAPLLIEEYK